MSNEIVKSETSLDEMQRMAKMLAASGYFEAAKDERTAVAQMATKIMAGRELGYGPFASVQGIHIIQGRPSVSASLMAAAVKNSPRYGYSVKVMDAKECVLEFYERMDGKQISLGLSIFTIADARMAGTKNLDKFPRNMLFARAISNGVRWYCPDVFSGNPVYTPEELGADTDDNGNVVTVAQKPTSHYGSPETTGVHETTYGSTFSAEDDVSNAEFSVLEPVDPSPRPGERGSPILPGESVWGLRGEKESQLEDPPPARTRSEILIDEIQKLGVKVSGTAWQQRKAKAVAVYSDNSAESIDELPLKSLELILATLQREAAALNITTGK